MKPVFALFSTLLLGASKVWLWGCVGGRYRWFSPPTLRLISWKQGHNYAITIIFNEFHKFWCIFDLRNNISKFEPKQTLFGLEGPSPVDGHTNCFGMKLYQSDLEGESRPIQQEISQNSQVGTGRLESLSTKEESGSTIREQDVYQSRRNIQP